MKLVLNIEKQHALIVLLAAIMISATGVMAASGQAGEAEGMEAATTSNPNPSQGHPVGEIELSEGAAQNLNMDGKNITNIDQLSDFFDDACPEDGEVVNEIKDDGSYTCIEISDHVYDKYLPDYPATSAVDMSGNHIVHVAWPEDPEDAATKGYVDYVCDDDDDDNDDDNDWIFKQCHLDDVDCPDGYNCYCDDDDYKSVCAPSEPWTCPA